MDSVSFNKQIACELGKENRWGGTGDKLEGRDWEVDFIRTHYIHMGNSQLKKKENLDNHEAKN